MNLVPKGDENCQIVAVGELVCPARKCLIVLNMRNARSPRSWNMGSVQGCIEEATNIKAARSPTSLIFTLRRGIGICSPAEKSDGWLSSARMISM